jgi:hypothetical protein
MMNEINQANNFRRSFYEYSEQMNARRKSNKFNASFYNSGQGKVNVSPNLLFNNASSHTSSSPHPVYLDN